MSTYLACFIICDFEYTDGNMTAGGFPVNLFARRSQIGNVHFAKMVAIRAANFYLEYFNIPYPLPKLGKNMKLDLYFLTVSFSFGTPIVHES